MCIALTELARGGQAMYGLRMRSASGNNPPKDHKFWNTQPVPQLGRRRLVSCRRCRCLHVTLAGWWACADEQSVEHSGPIEVKTLEDVRQEPIVLPAQFVWNDCDIADEKVVCFACFSVASYFILRQCVPLVLVWVVVVHADVFSSFLLSVLDEYQSQILDDVLYNCYSETDLCCSLLLSY